ncbi:MAG: hypothetical protein MUP16_01610 [Sedimentisphaerales bacterium]|nr:hypothetical protein [Sedimentisphaerales bacterium]
MTYSLRLELVGTSSALAFYHCERPVLPAPASRRQGSEIEGSKAVLASGWDKITTCYRQRLRSHRLPSTLCQSNASE